MRSIGKRNIKQLQEICRAELATHETGIPYTTIEARIRARIPAEWYDIWESAHDEIERIIGDEEIKDIHCK